MHRTVESFYAEHRKPHWPATYEEALKDPLVSRIVAIQWRIYAYPAMEETPHSVFKPQTRWIPKFRPDAIDTKKLAANDKDD